MAKKAKKKGTVINSLLYYAGMVVIFAGIWFLKDNLLLGINMMPIGLVLMFVGWLLDEYEVGYGGNL